MRTRQFLEHHGIADNPFADEDAQSDLIFKGHCIHSAYHPTWDKIYGNPSEPATAVVFGEKGAGKTALRLQIARHLAEYNADHPDHRAFVIQYDDFNPYLDRCRERFSGRRRRADRVLGQWKLWDHMDAILSLGVTQLGDRILQTGQTADATAWDHGPLGVHVACPRRRFATSSCWRPATTSPRPKESAAAVAPAAAGSFAIRPGVEMGPGLGIAVSAGVVILIADGSHGSGPEPVAVPGHRGRLAAAAVVASRKWHWRAWRIARNTGVLNRSVGPLRGGAPAIPGRADRRSTPARSPADRRPL